MNFICLSIWSYIFLISFAYKVNGEVNYGNTKEDIVNNKLLTSPYKTSHIYTTTTHKVTQNIFIRKIRNFINNPIRLECLTCRGNGTSKNDNNCYRGLVPTTEKCRLHQQCYIELHPHFIKRGCVTRNRLNRTFVCNCPLCNDKPFNDFSYYEYEDIRDWKYHNTVLQNKIGIDLICKVCETKGNDMVADNTCRRGKFVNYMVCGKNQVCYTNINGETSYVSRGCTNLPSYNHYYTYCNTTLCNTKSFYNDKIFPRRAMHTATFNAQSRTKIKALCMLLSLILIL